MANPDANATSNKPHEWNILSKYPDILEYNSMKITNEMISHSVWRNLLKNERKYTLLTITITNVLGQIFVWLY